MVAAAFVPSIFTPALAGDELFDASLAASYAYFERICVKPNNLASIAWRDVAPKTKDSPEGVFVEWRSQNQINRLSFFMNEAEAKSCSLEMPELSASIALKRFYEMQSGRSDQQVETVLTEGGPALKIGDLKIMAYEPDREERPFGLVRLEATIWEH
jgi:hypothetical protein